MKAILCETLGPPENLVLKDVKDPVAAENEAVVQVYAASLNFPDGLQIQGKYQFNLLFPLSPVPRSAVSLNRLVPGSRDLLSGTELWLFLDSEA